MEILFLTIVNMNITASYVIFFVLLARIPLKKAPKMFSYALWSVVFFRLICPVTFSSAFSFFKNVRHQYIPSNIGLMAQPQINIGSKTIDSIINQTLPSATPWSSVNPMQIILFIIICIWVIGMISLIFYSIISYMLIKRKLGTAMIVQDNIYESDQIISPFVLGIIKPKIYLPIGLLEIERDYISRHEKMHIRRFDYLIKPIAFVTLCIHWFNPLVWLSFILMSRDMEMSCDERVLREMGSEIKMDYSTSLLSLAVGKRMITGNPLAFGESNVKLRIQNVLNYKKPTFWFVVITFIAVSIFCFGFSSDPINNVSKKDSISDLYQYRTEYVGNNSKVVQIIERLKIPETFSRTKVQLHTNKSPYAVSITYKTTSGVAHQFIQNTDQALFDANAITMFALIKNMDKVQFILEHGTDSTVIERTRTWANSKISQDVWNAAKNEKMFRMLYENLIRSDILSEKVMQQVASIIEENMAIIISSPLQSSNPNDYIKKHKKEYGNILKVGEDALIYMLGQFNQGKDEGLRGHIMMRLCKDILGERNNVLDDSLSPREWYQKLAIR